MPPWIWPSTIIGLITTPKSSTAVQATMSVLPVSGSTSTSQMWQPAGKVKLVGSQNAVSLRPGSSSWPENLCGDVGVQCDIAPSRGFIGAGNAELSVLELDVAFRRFEKVRRDFLCLGLDLVERFDDRRHADRAGAGTIGPHAELHLVGIAVQDRNIFDRNSKPVGNDLRKRRLVTLAVGMRAGEDFDGTCRD